MDKATEDKAELALLPGADAVEVMLADKDEEQEEGEVGQAQRNPLVGVHRQ